MFSTNTILREWVITKSTCRGAWRSLNAGHCSPHCVCLIATIAPSCLAIRNARLVPWHVEQLRLQHELQVRPSNWKHILAAPDYWLCKSSPRSRLRLAWRRTWIRNSRITYYESVHNRAVLTCLGALGPPGWWGHMTEGLMQTGYFLGFRTWMDHGCERTIGGPISFPPYPSLLFPRLPSSLPLPPSPSPPSFISRPLKSS